MDTLPLPWISALVGALITILGRLVTNRFVSTRREEALLAGSTAGLVPRWVSAIYMLGQVLLFVAFISAFWLHWWAPVLVIAVYFLAGFVPSTLPKITAELRDGPYKRCTTCGTIRPIDYFALDKSAADGHVACCVACSNPARWNRVQQLKAQGA
jgi:hypothetical protein